MAGDVQLAPNVCHACKLRKKACDRALPSCGFCSKRSLCCRYDIDAPDKRRRSYNPGKHFVALPCEDNSDRLARVQSGYDEHTSKLQHASVNTHGDALGWTSVGVAERARGLMGSLGISWDQLGNSYFDRCHDWLQVITPPDFYRLARRNSQGHRFQVDESILFLCMWLIVSTTDLHTEINGTKDPMGASSLHSTIKALFSQAQSEVGASIPLMQGGLILAECEYAWQRPKVAYVTVATCVGMARILGIHNAFTCIPPGEVHAYDQLVSKQRLNLAWALPMIERMILAETDLDSRYALTGLPPPDTFLPPCMHRDGSPVFEKLSATYSTNVSEAGRQAQALLLFNEVLEVLPCIKERDQIILSKCSELGERVRAFLTFLVNQNNEDSKKKKLLPASVALCIRALFLLHGDILANFKQIYTEAAEYAMKTAWAALNTICAMMTDVVRVFGSSLPKSLPLCCGYNLADGLRHLSEARELDINNQSISDDIETLTKSAQQYCWK